MLTIKLIKIIYNLISLGDSSLETKHSQELPEGVTTKPNVMGRDGHRMELPFAVLDRCTEVVVMRVRGRMG